MAEQRGIFLTQQAIDGDQRRQVAHDKDQQWQREEESVLVGEYLPWSTSNQPILEEYG